MASRATQPRRVAISAVTPKTEVKPLPDSDWHHHGCIDCGARYSDVGGCHTGGENALCCECVFHRARPIWDQNQDPRECCLTNSAPVTDRAVLVAYRLGGRDQWWQCGVCKRAQTYQPMRLRPSYTMRHQHLHREIENLPEL